ncbi:MAG: carboxylesterase family protein [Bacteroidia bacterium]|nr:carboxylesterase family protein [Bacteroidia bacterium]
MKPITLVLFLSFSLLFSCRKDDIVQEQQVPSLHLQFSQPPFTLYSGAKFFKEVKYDIYPETAFDIFMPASSTPTALVVQIHGGGFKSGSKSDNYNSSGLQSEINTFLSKNIAFATLNYRLLLDVNEQDGVLKPLNDCKRALQFIRYYCKDFNIDKVMIALKGGSAGAGTSLWIGLSNDMAQPNSSDPILRESTRVKAIVANNTQATYNIVSWPTAVFGQYQPTLSMDTMIVIATPETVMQFYGISDLSLLNTPQIADYNSKVDMLAFISSDDPDIYLASAGIPYTFPQNKGNLIHHPLQAKSILDKANSKGVSCKAFIPEMNLDNTNGESAQDFIIRKLTN